MNQLKKLQHAECYNIITDEFCLSDYGLITITEHINKNGFNCPLSYFSLN